MIRLRFYVIVFVVFSSVFLTACSTTQIKSVWKDPYYALQPQRVMVIAVAKEPIYRRILEDEYVLQLKAHGTDAIASYTTLPDRSQDDQAAIAKMVVQVGADTVLISRLASKRSVRVYYPATASYRPHYYGTWPDYYRHGYESINSPGYTTKYEYALMETNLYDASNDNLIWAATTETGVESLNQTLIKPYIATILKLMVEYGLLRK
ncbi:MAG TPA: hypothetical protein VMV48_02970 [Gallionellaceae bacterium]|nr:hypothetical protein [Gallionellaceae bacterium]